MLVLCFETVFKCLCDHINLHRIIFVTKSCDFEKKLTTYFFCCPLFHTTASDDHLFIAYFSAESYRLFFFATTKSYEASCSAREFTGGHGLRLNSKSVQTGLHLAEPVAELMFRVHG